MLCLGIETSCDDTSLALTRGDTLLHQASSCQASVHALFGGVVPEVASREHARFIGPLCDMVLTEGRIRPSDIDVVAVARGPGLLGSLLVGIAFAKAFALGTGARLIGVNHLHAHLLVPGLEQPLIFPSVGLLVSGGHTHLYRMDGPFSISRLGRTLDDAAGEAFDKAGKMLGLPYPAGMHIDRLAEEGKADPLLFPRPYLGGESLDFSFSGLKTAMHMYLSRHAHLSASWEASTGDVALPEGELRRELADVCASYRLAVVETLVAKVKKAMELPEQSDVKALFLAGGVAANRQLRLAMSKLASDASKAFIVPEPQFCTDNGAMIAYLGGLLSEHGFEHDFSLEAIPRGRTIPDDMRRRPS